MTWTATERKVKLTGGRKRRDTKIFDDKGKLFCSIYPLSDDPAAIEEMRARARLIVAAEEMLMALQRVGDKRMWQNLNGELVWRGSDDNNIETEHPFDIMDRAIIAATEGNENV